MEHKYIVHRARLTYDRFLVKAKSVNEAARLVANGKIPEEAMAVNPDHDTTYDEVGSIVVLSEGGNPFLDSVRTHEDEL